MSSSVAETPAVAAGAPSRAAGSSFYHAMRILPRGKRLAMFEIYGFCRQVDDIADSALPPAHKLEQLSRWRSKIESLYAARTGPAASGLGWAIDTFALRKQDFLAVVDGMEMDAQENIRAPDWTTLDLYCDRVASAVGRLSVRVFGIDGEHGDDLAHHLGRALQLTNILRDLDEDAAMGRLYLPREALEHAGIRTSDPSAVVAHPSLAEACEPVVTRARMHYAQAEQIMAACPRAAVRAPRIMGVVYRAILDGMVARGWGAPRAPVRLPRTRLLWIVLRHAFL